MTTYNQTLDRLQQAGVVIHREVNPDFLLSSGRTLTFSRMPNGAQHCEPTTGHVELTHAEWAEYCAKAAGRQDASTHAARRQSELDRVAAMTPQHREQEQAEFMTRITAIIARTETARRA